MEDMLDGSWWQIYNNVIIPTLKDETIKVGDSTTARRYSENIVMEWWNNGQSQLGSMKPKPVLVQLDVDSSRHFQLPPNYYRPEQMWIMGNSTPFPRIDVAQAMNGAKGYYTINKDCVIANIGTNGNLKIALAYYAYYDRVNVNNYKTRRLDVPEWSWEALTLYVAMQAVTRESMADARYRKFVTSTDAGNPTHNPFLPVAKWLEQRFYNIIRMHSDDDFHSHDNSSQRIR